VRFRSVAEGSRAAIIEELSRNTGAQRSERRRAEAAEALRQLADGAMSVQFGKSLWVVTGEPLPYIVELAPHGRIVRVVACSEAEAVELALAQARGGEESVARLFTLSSGT
jgi:hypothetical protein